VTGAAVQIGMGFGRRSARRRVDFTEIGEDIVRRGVTDTVQSWQ
jgi:hypothetical protein